MLSIKHLLKQKFFLNVGKMLEKFYKETKQTGIKLKPLSLKFQPTIKHRSQRNKPN